VGYTGEVVIFTNAIKFLYWVYSSNTTFKKGKATYHPTALTEDENTEHLIIHEFAHLILGYYLETWPETIQGEYIIERNLVK